MSTLIGRTGHLHDVTLTASLFLCPDESWPIHHTSSKTMLSPLEPPFHYPKSADYWCECISGLSLLSRGSVVSLIVLITMTLLSVSE